MADIRLWNTATRRKEPLEPTVIPGRVGMYVCGPTVYDRAHLGNARPAVVFDTLYRLLRHVYGAQNVTYVRNITDVEDKIIARAAERGVAIDDLTATTAAWYAEDLAALGVLPPDAEPRATAHVPEMVAMIDRLVARGHAYAAEGHVLFAVASYPDYGALSGRSVEDMIAGARVEVAPYKRDPMDFVLWKPSAPHEPGWDSPWGRGRPGWHIECSAMARALLGADFDIHGGGGDLMFPHHENEIAQSRCAHPEAGFARIWMHNEMLQVEGKKMSKSLGNFFTVRDLLEKYDREFAIDNIGPAVRLRLLQAHYRSPLDASPSYIEAAATKLAQWWFWTHNHVRSRICASKKSEILEKSDIVKALADDLNTPEAIARIDAMVAELRRLPDNYSDINDLMRSQEEIAKHIVVNLELLGIDFYDLEVLDHDTWQQKLKERVYRTEIIEELIAKRRKARSERNFEKADSIRDAFERAGVVVRDTPSGTKWELMPGFDLDKLKALE